MLQLRDGRILLPFSYSIPARWNNRGRTLADFSYRGYYRSTVLFSDDLGATWNTGPQSLPVPVPDISYAYGAVEPVAIELADGRVWMLIRTQMGRFYEAFSRDGLRWSDPRPTRLLSSDSPAGLVRLADGRLVLLWNNCLRFPAGCRRTRGRGHTASRVPGSQLPARLHCRGEQADAAGFLIERCHVYGA